MAVKIMLYAKHMKVSMTCGKLANKTRPTMLVRSQLSDIIVRISMFPKPVVNISPNFYPV